MSLNHCTNCNHPFSEGQKYCGNCGVGLLEQKSESNKTVDYYVSPKSPILSTFQGLLKKKQNITIIGIVLIALLVLSFIPGKNTPSDVAEEFIILTQTGEYESAEALWSQDGIDYMLSQLMGDERWIVQSMRNFTHRTDGDLIEYEITDEEEMEEGMKVVYANFEFSNGRRETAELAMVNEDGEWKVFAFNSY
ncbi:zinc ribbon domain-containing protein [Bacillus sp. RO1]|uniref:DUF4878 domain-containing protein n=1 Tax=Bacillus sp. RO1 TaxID=2722703 RepID=UPI0014573026|nr:zinc ribbon domain-containing protein [Bacillus sp. RO1]NLP51852.1 zinc ribbon domain-containing protein [Bacillus sp. RO1]